MFFVFIKGVSLAMAADGKPMLFGHLDHPAFFFFV
jgi:hypothetical protein